MCRLIEQSVLCVCNCREEEEGLGGFFCVCLWLPVLDLQPVVSLYLLRAKMNSIVKSMKKTQKLTLGNVVEASGTWIFSGAAPRCLVDIYLCVCVCG